MSKKYKVLPIGMLIQGNKMANHGDIVEEVNLLSDPGQLIKDGFIEEVKELKEVKEEKPKK